MNTKKKKIAFIANVYRHLDAFHIPFMRQLQHKGYEVHAYARADNCKERVIQQDVICHDIPFERNPYHINNVKSLKLLLKKFNDERYEMVHLHTPVASILGRIAAKRAKVPLVVYTAHGFHFFTGAKPLYWLIYYPVERLLARWTDYLITINKQDYDRAKKFKVRKKLIYMPGVGVDAKNYFLDSDELRINKRRELGISINDFVILYVAELSKRKNQIQLIEAIKHLKSTSSIKCMFVGTGENELELKLLIKKYQLEDAFLFLNYRRDIPELLCAADILALLSTQEGLPRAILEALAAGKPVVATAIRGNVDLINNGENGFLVPLNNVQHTAIAIQKLMNDRELLKVMGEKARKCAMTYNLDHIIDEMDQVYEHALFNNLDFKNIQMLGE